MVHENEGIQTVQIVFRVDFWCFIDFKCCLACLCRIRYISLVRSLCSDFWAFLGMMQMSR